MNKKTRKLFTWCLVVALVVTQMLFANVAFAATSYSGADRYQTALKVVQAGWTKNDSAVIARGDDLADALAAAPLAYAKGKAPILLTETAKLPAGVMDELVALGVKNVYIVGGTGAVSAAVETELAAKFTVKRLSGADRAATALAVAKEAFPTAPAKAVMVNGYAVADALSISAIAAYNGMPILLVDKDTKAADVATYLTGKTVYAVGGEGVISAANLGTATRLSGADRYATNVAVLGAFTLDYSKVFVAVGEDANAVDALGGAAFAALGNNPIVLVNGALTTAQSTFLSDKIASDTAVFTLGGVVPASVATAIEALAPSTLAVKSVSAINAAQLQVTFTKAVDDSTVLDSDGTLKASVFTLTKVSGTGSVVIDGTSLAKLSADGKTLTITVQSGAFNKVNYVLTVPASTIADLAGNYLAAYTSSVLSANDTTSPTVTGVTKLDASNVRVSFSEPLSSVGNLTFKFADGTAASVTPNTSTLAKGYVDLAIGGGVTAGKDITATIIGAADYANNLVNPNPSTVTFTKGALDGVAPAVTSITPLSLGSFEIKFSEEVQGFAATDVVIDGVARTANDATPALAGTEAIVTQDDTDVTKYVVEFVPFGSTGLHTVGLAASAVNDLSGEVNALYSKVYQFTADTTAPTLVKSEVKTVSGIEYLYLTFSEGVNEGSDTALTATQVKNYVTTYGTVDLSGLTSVADSGDKQYRVALSAVTFDPTGAATAAAIADGATYTVALGGAFTDKSSVALGTTSITFGRGVDTDLLAPSVVKTVDAGESSPYVASNGIAVVDNDTFQVTFDRVLDGATATNKANYAVNGATVESATLLAGNVVEVAFKSGTVALTGMRNVAISGVKSSDGVVMDAYTTSEYFVENVAPTFTATLFATNCIKVTFSEPVVASSVTGASLSGTIDTADVVVYYNGSAVTVNATNGVEGVYKDAAMTTSFSAGDAATTLYIKLAGTAVISDITKTLEVAVPSTSDLADATKTGTGLLPADVIGNSVVAGKVPVAK